MGFNCGIVGLPNVGKSTLFNALTSTTAAQAANYPFCTIVPNVGIVAVPDARLSVLACIGRSTQKVPTQISFVDIAGLVRGASRGEGLGNKFLAYIRSCDAIAHVIRCFENEDITHVEGSVDPIRDADTVETELILADLDSLEWRAGSIAKKAKAGDKEAKNQMEVVEALLGALRAGKPARSVCFEDSERVKMQRQFLLLTAKPVLYVCNVNETAAATGNCHTERVSARAAAESAAVISIAAAVEAEVAQLADTAERQTFLATLDLREASLSRLVNASYRLLDLITFFTVGPKEARAWTVRHGAKAPEAARVIHSDFEKGFIRAQTIAYEDFLAHNGEQGAREAGKMRLEGSAYTVVDGDIMHFLFNV